MDSFGLSGVVGSPARPALPRGPTALKKLSQETLKSSPFALHGPRKYYPNVVTPRLRAQEGLFVAFSEIERPLDDSLRSSWTLERFAVAATDKERLRYELFRLGVHTSSLFPDLEGLTSRIAWQHSVSPLARPDASE